MGKKGQQSKKGIGEKEPDGSPRNRRLQCFLPEAKIATLKAIAKSKKSSLTDIVSEAIDFYLNVHKSTD
ncbi:hypothetical protein NIES2119_09945 [[Phormidium ambiguum] IAM M-71]|uniref:CopG family transcriptional regulator n=1 Tax=[Phormidium ambiguum] IAM M-71 TaxID=454136 RepID=A0A1U7IM28_9CYAN|nr:hypothetical protein NIES2119_09945 [Phormidium ambiguum IAM M-71]